MLWHMRASLQQVYSIKHFEVYSIFIYINLTYFKGQLHLKKMKVRGEVMMMVKW